MSTRERGKERRDFVESRIVSIPPPETLLSYGSESKERERVCLRKDRQSFPRPVSNRGKRFVLRSKLGV